MTETKLVGQRMLTHDQTAEALHISPSGLDKLLAAGKAPPFVVIGGGSKRKRRRFPLELLETYLRERLSA